MPACPDEGSFGLGAGGFPVGLGQEVGAQGAQSHSQPGAARWDQEPEGLSR